jgi:transcriptional activator protein UGA3
MGRKKTACQICASIKAVCSRGSPCTRCQRLHLPCQTDNSPPQDTCVTVNRNKSKVGHTRSAAGCVDCRRRRKKCDEQKPVCGDCQRLALPCRRREVPAAQATLSPASSRSDTGTPLDHAEITMIYNTNTTTTTEPSTGSDLWEARITENLAAPQAAAFSDWIALIGSDNSAGLGTRSNLANSTALVDLPVPCARDDEVGMAMFLPPTALNNLTGITRESLRSWSIPERHLLNHFLQSVSRTLVIVEDTDNPFLRVIVPMALENTTVRASLVALSASHLSKVYPEFGRDTLVHRSLALRGLKEELGNPNGIECALATTLLLCLVEVIHTAFYLKSFSDNDRYAKGRRGNGNCILTVRMLFL